MATDPAGVRVRGVARRGTVERVRQWSEVREARREPDEQHLEAPWSGDVRSRRTACSQGSPRRPRGPARERRHRRSGSCAFGRPMGRSASRLRGPRARAPRPPRRLTPPAPRAPMRGPRRWQPRRGSGRGERSRQPAWVVHLDEERTLAERTNGRPVMRRPARGPRRHRQPAAPARPPRSRPRRACRHGSRSTPPRAARTSHPPPRPTRARPMPPGPPRPRAPTITDPASVRGWSEPSGEIAAVGEGLRDEAQSGIGRCAGHRRRRRKPEQQQVAAEARRPPARWPRPARDPPPRRCRARRAASRAAARPAPRA